MNYVVVVLDPVPEDLSAAIDVVAERFRIGHDKARALLARVPGPVTKSVPEGQARTVADILEQAGLRVELRPGDAAVQAVANPAHAAEPVARAPVDDVVAAPADQVELEEREGDEDEAQPGSEALPAERAQANRAQANRAHAEPGHAEPGHAEPGHAEPARAEPGRAERAPVDEPRTRPEPGLTTTTPPRDPMKTTLTREPPDLERSGLRRRISSAATLPAILTLLVTLLALTATLLPVLRAQQARRAADTAAAVAATIEGLSAGLPLSAPIIRAELRQVEELS